MEIFGFKSFADRSRIEFTPGITALLGPNGCGKSNVVDALKWVLGEQASRSLRADKMEDIIFNGTETRKSLAVAEVSLTLSNEEHVLDLDVPEICVKRRLYRSGESEYFVNNTPVKLKELRELFYDTGVGKSAYSVMEQGRIDQILSTKPEERRYLFEEAAGITKFKMRGQEAERKLEKTEENIRQIEGIIGEVRRSRETLQKQSEKTQTYRRLRQEIFELEKRQQLLRLKTSYENRSLLEAKLQTSSLARAQAQASLDALNRTLEAGLGEVNHLEEKLVSHQKSIYGLDMERSSVENQIKILSERRSHHENQVALAQSRAKTLVERKEELKEEIRIKTEELERLRIALRECMVNIQSFEANVETANLEIHENERCILVNEKTLTDWEKEETSYQTGLREITDRLVEEIDEGMKTSSDWSSLSAFGETVEESLSTLRVQLGGRLDLLNSLLETKSWPDSDPWSFIEKIVASLEEISKTLKMGMENWEKFRDSVPRFFQDFLAPEGVLTQKRTLELRIEEGRARARQLREDSQERREKNARHALTLEGYRKSLEDLRIGRERMKTQSSSLDSFLAELHKRVGEQDLAIGDNESDKKEHLERIRLIDLDLQTLSKNREDFAFRDQELRRVASELETFIQDKNHQMLGREKEIKAGMEELSRLQEGVESLQIQKAQQETEIHALFDHFRDKHSVDLSEFEAELPTLEVDRNEKEKLAERREELKTIGQVNLMAVEEFAEIDERYQFLSRQIDDLKKARDDLHQVTHEIKKESMILFEQTFQEIRKNFHQIFRRLFGGGRAELRLTDTQNVLESGIEMLCQPPGKKLESINLLSGGEKSMTAVALLFATFLVKPSPFCVLDEIDAALDESNVDRFIQMLTEFALHSQFVVISHNKRTVTGASTMIGVTMEEPGISKIIAVRLASSQAEAAESPE